MKAIDVINLCEDEQLNSQEIFNLIYDYFVKKMKLAGMRVFDDGISVEAELSSSVITGHTQAKYYSRFYVRKLSKLFGNVSFNIGGGDVFIKHPNPTNSIWRNHPIFYASTALYSSYHHQIDEFEIIFRVSFSDLIKNLMRADSLNSYPEFSTEQGRKEIFELIDSLAKFIRLTPLGTE